VNELIGDLVRSDSGSCARHRIVANGDLSQRVLPEIDGLAMRGEFRRIGKAVNTMVTQLNGFASECRGWRVRWQRGQARGQARAGVAGTWKDLTDNVNAMAANLTGQVRNIAE